MSELARPEDQDAQLWRTAYQLFEEALEHPEPARAAFARHQASDPNLLAIVLELLREYSEEDLDEAPSVHARLSPGSRVGRYEICAKLGRGGMGWVYSARDVELGRFVALKFLDTKSVSPNRLVQEAKAASALSHPNIVTIYELVREGADVALVMELVDGQTMRELCGAPQPERRLANWGRQIACALAATHAMGIVHRDIKPENLMLRPDGFVKVLDFGLARRILGPASVTQASFSGALAGTFQYLSPEITRGESPGPPTDVFSLGVVLYELGSGRNPFASPSPIDTAYAIAHQELKPCPGLSDSWNTLFRQMMAKNPAERPAASEVESRLRLLECAPSPSPESATTSLSRRGLFAAALGGAVLSGTVAARWWPGKSSNPDSPLASAPFQLNFPPGLELMSSFGPTVAISANGQVLGALLGAAPDKPSAVHLWRSGAREPLRVPGTEGANSFFLSPAGDSLAVRQHGTLYRIDRNGAKTRLAPISFGPESGIWADDGALYYSSAHPHEPGRLTTVWRLPSDGASRPEALLADDHPELGALYLLVLQILPDGRHLLVSESRSSFRTLFAFDLKTRTRKTLLEGVNGGHYLPTGHVLHHRGINLYAQRLNESNLSVSGAPVLVQRGVAQASWSGGNLSLSRLGTLVYQPRDREIADRTLVWVDRNGQETSLGLPPGPHEPSTISPDGAHVLIRRYDAEEGNWSLWMLTLRSAEWIELATGLSAPGEAVWSPDGNEIIYHLPTGLSRRRVFPLGPPTVITRESRLAHHPAHLFPGHHSLLISQGYQPVITASVLSIPLNPAGGRLDTVLQAHLHPALSADGRWLATSRRDRIYIQPFPIRPDARLLDAGEGGSPIWSADGRWLYWRAGRRIVAARFSAHDPPRLSPSRVIAEGDFLPYTKWLRMIAFCNKSQRFLLARNWRPEPPARSLQVVPDFMAKVRQLCPP